MTRRLLQKGRGRCKLQLADLAADLEPARDPVMPLGAISSQFAYFSRFGGKN